MFAGANKYAVGLVVVMQFLAAGALKCVCNPDDCEVIRSTDCPGRGITLWDPCKCCRVCAKTSGESCGGPNGFSGTCEPPLQCIAKQPSLLGEQDEQQSGTCMVRTHGQSPYRISLQDLQVQLALKKKQKYVNIIFDFTSRKLDCEDRITLDPGCEIANGRCKCWKNVKRCRNATHHWSYRNIDDCRLNLSVVLRQTYAMEPSIPFSDSTTSRYRR